MKKISDLKKMHINQLVDCYLSTNSDLTFREFYGELLIEYRGLLRYWRDNTQLSNEHDIKEFFDDTILRVIQRLHKSKSTGGELDFINLFAKSLHNKHISLVRKIKIRKKHEVYEGYSDEKENELRFSNIADDYTLEDEVTKKKEVDQHELIDFLTDPRKVNDETTTAIVETFLSYEGKRPTPTAIGKQLGIHHMIVKRKLERLAKHFDSKEFGDYRDYLLA